MTDGALGKTKDGPAFQGDGGWGPRAKAGELLLHFLHTCPEPRNPASTAGGQGKYSAGRAGLRNVLRYHSFRGKDLSLIGIPDQEPSMASPYSIVKNARRK